MYNKVPIYAYFYRYSILYLHAYNMSTSCSVNMGCCSNHAYKRENYEVLVLIDTFHAWQETNLYFPKRIILLIIDYTVVLRAIKGFIIIYVSTRIYTYNRRLYSIVFFLSYFSARLLERLIVLQEYL